VAVPPGTGTFRSLTIRALGPPGGPTAKKLGRLLDRGGGRTKPLGAGGPGVAPLTLARADIGFRRFGANAPPPGAAR